MKNPMSIKEVEIQRMADWMMSIFWGAALCWCAGLCYMLYNFMT